MEDKPLLQKPNCSSELQCEWLKYESKLRTLDSLKTKLIIEDDFNWKLSGGGEEAEEDCRETLKYVGGVDLSFSKDDPSIACGALVVLDLDNLNVVYEDSLIVKLDVPYVPGFLAFREAPVLLQLLEKMKKSAHPFYPQLLMVDGNGLLHPRGVLSDIPSIGIGKNLHHVDGLTTEKVRHLLEAQGTSNKDIFTLTGDSGSTLGVAMRSQGTLKPIFVSVGHRISLTTAINIVKMTCKYRIPEPTRQADMRSKLTLGICSKLQ
ncbi:OLC1v1030678C1 [Oldenlandia corymbosa var. corymbosa]|uniref:OLC1v1030678C1 n=1 Tax=Oldenlandia corymbosa var. corymbosa TaxID=529605 RepID=A0AAV1CHH1_OLDCO|nr:OLC1v1030678C1 [Oldenlandia corymbosa var. corymbosa]